MQEKHEKNERHKKSLKHLYNLGELGIISFSFYSTNPLPNAHQKHFQSTQRSLITRETFSGVNILYIYDNNEQQTCPKKCDVRIT